MTKIIDAKPDPSIRALTDEEALNVTGAALTVARLPVSGALLTAIERLKTELRVALPRF
jgi:hypothetical protein